MKLSDISGTRELAAAARRCLAGLAVACVLAGTAQAQAIKWTPHAGVDWESNSNIYYSPDDAAAVPGARPKVSGQLVNWLAGLDVRHQGEGGTTYLTGEARRYDYSSSVGQLDHNEYNGAFGHILGREAGNHFGFEVGGSRKLAPFIALDSSTVYAYETQRYGRAEGSIAVSGDQSFNGLVERDITKTPIAGAANYGTTVNRYSLGYTRTATRSLSYGTKVGLDQGAYDGLTGNGAYRQLVPELFLRYSVPSVAEVDLSGGLTRRSQVGLVTQTNSTGALSVRYELGVKTSAQLAASRRVQPYYATAGVEVATTYSAGLTWRPTSLISFEVLGGRTSTDVQVITAATTTQRTDHFSYGSATINWQPTRWLKVGLFGRKQDRKSTLAAYQFDVSSYGATFRIQKP